MQAPHQKADVQTIRPAAIGSLTADAGPGEILIHAPPTSPSSTSCGGRSLPRGFASLSPGLGQRLGRFLLARRVALRDEPFQLFVVGIQARMLHPSSVFPVAWDSIPSSIAGPHAPGCGICAIRLASNVAVARRPAGVGCLGTAPGADCRSAGGCDSEGSHRASQRSAPPSFRYSMHCAGSPLIGWAR